MAEFDAVAASYVDQHARSVRLSGEGTDYFARYKIADARRIADKRGLAVKSILDFGAGIGNSLGPMREIFPEARITCLDVSEQSLELCRKELAESVEFRVYDGELLPTDLGKFDLIFTACVFHHIPESLHVSLLRQIRQLLRKGGLFLMFEHNPWNPLTRHAVNTCPFDANAVLISAPEMRRRLQTAGFADTQVSYRVFFPGPLAALRVLEPALAHLPIGAQYSVAAR
jgi:SAM-dependent methyltransferase